MRTPESWALHLLVAALASTCWLRGEAYGDPQPSAGASSASPSSTSDTPPVPAAPVSPPPPAAGTAPVIPPPPLSPEEQRQLEQAIGDDAQARKAQAPSRAPAVPPGATFAPPAATPNGSWSNAARRTAQLLNPDISVIVDFAAGYYSELPVLSGDDPADTGMNLQEVEMAFSASVDPYFFGAIYLTIPNVRGIEVEEAFVQTTSLPGGLQLRGGLFRAALGRQNTQHLHVQNFTRRPELNALLLGEDGMRAPGLEVSWLVPLPFYLMLTAEAFSVAGVDEAGLPLATFGGGSRTDFSYVGNLKTFMPFSETTSLLLGFNFASGKSSHKSEDPELPFDDDQRRTYLYGADAFFKWKPPNVAKTYMSVAWTTEFFLRHIPSLGDRLEGALYSDLVWQMARRWFLGVRGEVEGLPTGPAVNRSYAGAGSLTWQLSEFARARIYGEVRFPESRNTTYAGFLQLEASLGAHGAHPY